MGSSKTWPQSRATTMGPRRGSLVMGSSSLSSGLRGRLSRLRMAASERPRRRTSSSRAFKSSYVGSSSSAAKSTSCSWPVARTCSTRAWAEQKARPHSHQRGSSSSGSSPPQWAASASSVANVRLHRGHRTGDSSSGACPVESQCAARACGEQNVAPHEQKYGSTSSPRRNSSVSEAKLTDAPFGMRPPQWLLRPASVTNT
mmetsp:Transcript_28911/g.93211  ORF Transcript_28911/g.93211 Transcript_28911/m.93211 type:complete len:201 (+) Transcript_28911:307-909(+)